jgi:hypothetical protein
VNPYLAKLRDETHHLYGPSKPSKPIFPVADHANTTIGIGFEGFEGALRRCPSEHQQAPHASSAEPGVHASTAAELPPSGQEGD